MTQTKRHFNEAYAEHRPEACATLIIPPEEVRARFKRVKPLGEIKAKERGWTLDVLNAIRRLGKTAFATADTYVFTRQLERLHPENRNIKAKIRQQLPPSLCFGAASQKLRDRNLLLHIDRNPDGRHRGGPPALALKPLDVLTVPLWIICLK